MQIIFNRISFLDKKMFWNCTVWQNFKVGLYLLTWKWKRGKWFKTSLYWKVISNHHLPAAGGVMRCKLPLRNFVISPYICLLIPTHVFPIYTLRLTKTIHFLKPLLEGVVFQKLEFDLVRFPGISGRFRLVIYVSRNLSRKSFATL